LFIDSIRIDQGVQFANASIPLSQNKLRRAGLNPDIIDTFFCYDKLGKPLVLRKFQKRMCGGLKGVP
jgi:hypothetical protein